jgi:hypothetical protein
VDPEIRITRISGEKYYNVLNIFFKAGPVPSAQAPEAGRRAAV